MIRYLLLVVLALPLSLYAVDQAKIDRIIDRLDKAERRLERALDDISIARQAVKTLATVQRPWTCRMGPVSILTRSGNSWKNFKATKPTKEQAITDLIDQCIDAGGHTATCDAYARGNLTKCSRS